MNHPFSLGSPVAVVQWSTDDEAVELLDQTRLPAQTVYLRIRTVEEMHDAIKRLCVRGAPAIGIAAAYGVCLSLRHKDLTLNEARQHVADAVSRLATSRPTAVNLFWALDRMTRVSSDHATFAGYQAALLAEADRIAAEDRSLCDRLGQLGADRLADATRFLTHCNAGALATGGSGTALAPIYELRRRGRSIEVFADETRPLLQGARLTAWELHSSGVPVTIITDSMAGCILRDRAIDAVIVGADRITARGDVANKIGTYPLAVLAKYHGVPFFVAAPYSTFDLKICDGRDIPIEQREPDEILAAAGWASAGAPSVFNPAFDVTPAELITAIITDRGVIENPCQQAIESLLHPAGSE